MVPTHGSVRVCEDCTGVTRDPASCGLCSTSAPGVTVEAATVSDSWHIKECVTESLGVCAPPVTSTVVFVVDEGLSPSELESLATVIARTLSSLDEVRSLRCCRCIAWPIDSVLRAQTVLVLMITMTDRCLRLYALHDPSTASCRCFPVYSNSKPLDLSKCSAIHCQPPAVAREAIATIFTVMAACPTRNCATPQSIQAAISLSNDIFSDDTHNSCTVVLCLSSAEDTAVVAAAEMIATNDTPSIFTRVSSWLSSMISPSTMMSSASKYVEFETRNSRMCVHAVVPNVNSQSSVLSALQQLTKTSGGQLYTLPSLCDLHQPLLSPFPHGSTVRIVVSRPLIVTRFLGRLVSGDSWQLLDYCWSTISRCDKYRSYDIVIPCNSVCDGILLEFGWEYGSTANHGDVVSIQVHRSVRSQLTLAQHNHTVQCITVPVSSNCDTVLSSLDCEVTVALLVKSIVAGILSEETKASCAVIDAACRAIRKVCLSIDAWCVSSKVVMRVLL